MGQVGRVGRVYPLPGGIFGSLEVLSCAKCRRNVVQRPSIDAVDVFAQTGPHDGLDGERRCPPVRRHGDREQAPRVGINDVHGEHHGQLFHAIDAVATNDQP